MSRRYLKFPHSALAALLALYVAITLCAMIGTPTWSWIEVRTDMAGTRLALIGFGCLLAGALRAGTFHPHYVKKYAAWLMATPWRPGVPLPLGPVHLVWEDLIFLLPVTAFTVLDAQLSPWIPVSAYLLAYSSALLGTLRGNRAIWFGLLLSFVWSWPVAVFDHFAVALGIALGVVMVCSQLMIVLSLRDFPWNLGDGMREVDRRPRAGLAWPLDRVGPITQPKPVSPAIGWTLASLAGWWVFIGLSDLAPLFNGLLMQTIAVEVPGIFVLLSVMRFLKYCGRHWPPISLLGRLFTGRWIVPGYDYVLIAPLLTCALSYLLPRLLNNHLRLPLSAALTASAATAVLLNLGPTLKNWQLTGHHRMLPLAIRDPAVPKTRTSR